MKLSFFLPPSSSARRKRRALSGSLSFLFSLFLFFSGFYIIVMSGQSTNPRRPVSIMSNRDRTSTDPERSLLTTAASDPELDTRKERGSKTPRRVQWSDGLHSLDEHGFDVRSNYPLHLSLRSLFILMSISIENCIANVDWRTRASSISCCPAQPIPFPLASLRP